MNMSGGEEKSALESYGVDLTARARAGKLDPVIGRDAEIHRTIQVLSRRTKNVCTKIPREPILETLKT